jgi:hypothetical protein
LPPARNAAQQAARSAILAAAVIGRSKGQDVSYSRNWNFYTGQRYWGTKYTFTTVTEQIDLLSRLGVIINNVVPQGNLGWQSSFRATDELMQVWGAMTGQMVYMPSPESIWLRNDAKQLIPYQDTRRIRQMRKELGANDEMLACLDIEVPGAKHRGPLLIFEGDGGKLTHVLRRPGNGTVRIFNRGSFAKGGRMIGWHQGIPKTYRAGLTINGEATDEVDYSRMHAMILYGQAGIRFTGDAYEVDGFDSDSEVKPAFNIALNAKNDRATVGAIADKLGCTRDHAAKLLAAIKHRHKPIAHHFASDAGVGLMRTESDIMADAAKRMRNAGIPVLTVHDAAIVQARNAIPAQSILVQSFEQIVGRVNPCQVKIKGLSLLHKGRTGGCPGGLAPALAA